MNTDIVTQLLEQYKYSKFCRQFTDKGMWSTPEGNKRFDRLENITEEDIEKHLNKEHLLVAQVRKALAWDIDEEIEEDVLLEALEKAHDDGYDIYATPSTSGKSYHLYLYLTKHVELHQIDAAREMAKVIAEKYFTFPVDKYYPALNILTVPFHSDYVMIDYTGAEVTDMTGKISLRKIANRTGIRIPTKGKENKEMRDKLPNKAPARRPASSKNTTYSEKTNIKKAPKKQISSGQWEAFYAAMSAATSKEESIAIYSAYYKEGMRHQMALDSSSLFFRWGMSRQETLDVVGTIAAQHGDKEIADRLRCVEDTYNRIDFGQPVSGFANHHAPRTAFEAKFWGEGAREISQEDKFRVKTERIIGAMFHVIGDKWGRVSKRSLSEMTGLSASTVIRHIQAMIAEGMVQRKGSNQHPDYKINLSHDYFHALLKAEGIIEEIDCSNSIEESSPNDSNPNDISHRDLNHRDLEHKDLGLDKKEQEGATQEQPQGGGEHRLWVKDKAQYFLNWIGRLTERLGNAILAVSETERQRLRSFRHAHWLDRMGFQRLTKRKPAAA